MASRPRQRYIVRAGVSSILLPLLGGCSLCVSLGSTKRDEQSRHDETTDHKPEGLPEAPDPHPAVLRVQLISHAKRNYHERTGGSAYLAVVLRPAIRVPQPDSGRARGREE